MLFEGGGATAVFEAGGNMQSLTVEGRWANERTARIYINSGLAALATMRLSAPAKTAIAKATSYLDKILSG